MCVEPNNQTNGISEESVSVPAFIKDAYPMPRYSIKDAVMAQVAEERAAAGEKKEKETKILTFGEKVQKHRRTFAKWGSIAACAVFLLGVLAVVSPMLDKANDAAEMSRGTDNYGITTADAYDQKGEEEAGLYYSVCDNEAAEAATEAANDYLTDDAEAEYTTGASSKVGIMQSQLYAATTNAPAENAAGAATEAETAEKIMAATEAAVESVESEDAADCIKTLVAEQIPHTEYTAWLTSNSYTAPEDYSLVELVTDFAISRKTLTQTLGTYADMVDLDALYSPTTQQALPTSTPAELDEMVIDE